MEPIFLFTINNQLTYFIEVTDLDMMNDIFRDYGEIDGFYPEENCVRMIVPYNPSKPLARLIKKF